MPKSSSTSKPKNGKAKKRQYQRTTSVGRVCKNLERGIKTVLFAAERMTTWKHSSDLNLLTALSLTDEALSCLSTAHKHMVELYESNWAPPRKSLAIVFAEGEGVKISAKYRDKYLKVYTQSAIEDLIVAKILDTGEVAVRHGANSPFLVPKSHIDRRREG